MIKLNKKSLIIALAAATPLFFWAGSTIAATDEDALRLLGKNIFFDEISIAGNKQSCSSCHDPARGWILPNSVINGSTVVAPGAAPHAIGNIKPPSNAYASFSPPFREIVPDPVVSPPPWEGGNFWDGRAEGYGAPTATGFPVGNGVVSATVTEADLGFKTQYAKYLGPTADQALNPFPNDVEMNIREEQVCQRVKTAGYENTVEPNSGKSLYETAFGEPIDCSSNSQDNPAYHISFKRIAVALAAWQASDDVNSFSSRRDTELAKDKDGKFPLDGFTDQENLGHDLFYNLNDSCQNPKGARHKPPPNKTQCIVTAETKRGNCVFCHNSGAPGSDGTEGKNGETPQLYTDFRYHHIGVPYNREIPGVTKEEKTGLTAHVTSAPPGNFKTPTLRNVEKEGAEGFIKDYTHNGWFKSLESLIHFYNTRDELRKTRPCEGLGIIDAMEKEALQNNCWPAPEFANPVTIIGNLGLSDTDEAALAAYVKTLIDEHTPMKP